MRNNNILVLCIRLVIFICACLLVEQFASHVVRFFVGPAGEPSSQTEQFGGKSEGKSGGKSEEIIPRHIYQTWHTKTLPENMQKGVDTLKSDNPEFEHHLFDDSACREFIVSHFSKEVVAAYDSLIPEAFKADLWRYCVLYKMGGVYLDIKYYTVAPFKLVELTDKEYLMRDVPTSGGGVYNALLVCKAGNAVLKQCIDAVVKNTEEKYYGESVFDITGPLLMKRFVSDSELAACELSLGEGNGCPDKTCIYKSGTAIMSMYKTYRNDQRKTGKPTYFDQWVDRKVYNPAK